MNARRYTISLPCIVLMVALRVLIGWHFFQEGLSHKKDPQWSSEGFLRQAKGPFANLYKDQLPSFHKWEVLLVVPFTTMKKTSESIAAGSSTSADAGDDEGSDKGKPSLQLQDSPVYGKWYAEIVHDWTQKRQEIANFYSFSKEQIQASDSLLDQYVVQLGNILIGYEGDIRAYRHALNRNQEMAGVPGALEIPSWNARLRKRTTDPMGEPGVSVASSPTEWRADAEALEKSLEKDLTALATPNQMKAGTLVENSTKLKKIDSIVIWTLIIGGGCLVVGLFTRLSAVVLALFLASIIISQPPWLAGTMPTYFHAVECLALLVLASTYVGRWGGLDFLVHHLLTRLFKPR